MSAINVNNVWTNILDNQTGESVNFEEVTTWVDGTPMDDAKVDGVIYRKLPTSVGGGYVKRAYSGPIDFSWFSPDDSGMTDVSELLQKAVVLQDDVYIPKGTYLISQTVLLPSGISIIGESDTVLKSPFTEESTGGYPETIFTNSNHGGGNVNISINNITFDFSRNVTAPAQGAGLTTNPGLYWEGVTNLTFNNCRFQNFVTNRDTDLSGEARAMNNCLAAFNSCSDVIISSPTTTYVREEGLVFLNCTSIRISDWFGDGAGGQSSQAAFWYCNGVRVENSRFVQSSGSVLNIYSTNVVISNITVNKGTPRWGRGVDIGNELGTQLEFEPSNITIENSYFNCFSYGVGTGLGGNELNPLRNVVISNNTFNVNEATTGTLTGFHRCVIISNPDSWLISNNTIDMANTTGATQGVAFSLRNNNLTDNFSGVTISNNTVNSVTFLSLVYPSGPDRYLSIEDLILENNRFRAIDGELAPVSGAYNFIYIRDQSTSDGVVNINNITVRGNRATEIRGGFYVEFIASGSTIMDIGSIIIEDNYFSGPDAARMDFPIRMRPAGRVSPLGVFKLHSNTILRGRGMRISNQNFLTVSDNIIDYQGEDLLLSPVSVEGVSDLVRFKDNYIKNQSTAYDIISNLTESPLPIYVDITGNVAYNNSGTKFFRTNFINSQKINETSVQTNGATLLAEDGSELVGTPVSGVVASTTVSAGSNYPSASGVAWTFNRTTLRGCFTLFRNAASNDDILYIQTYDASGVGHGWSQLNPMAAPSLDTATAAPASYDQAQVQAILDELRDLKAKMRDAGLLDPQFA